MAELLEADVDPDPVRQFGRWFEEAQQAGIRVPEAMAVATATPEGRPSVRMVLLKGYDERGFVFYTCYESRKGRELAENPRAALLFHWDTLGRQVRVEGAVERLPPAESDAYFVSRPRGSRLSAVASRQSELVPGRETLDARVTELAATVGEAGPERPDWWGGYRVVPDSFELWQHRDDRLHDRLRYRRSGDAWIVERLAP
ncbi:MAG TPA: pyridoxamine 5'-phosphate oxidase [Gaiellaceae bacterium]